MPQLIDQCSTVENGRVYCFPIAFQFKPSYWLPQSKPSSILQLQEIVWGCLILITVNWKYFNLAENIYNRVCGRDSVWRLNIQISEKAWNWRKGWVKGGLKVTSGTALGAEQLSGWNGETSAKISQECFNALIFG